MKKRKVKLDFSKLKILRRKSTDGTRGPNRHRMTKGEKRKFYVPNVRTTPEHRQYPIMPTAIDHLRIERAIAKRLRRRMKRG